MTTVIWIWLLVSVFFECIGDYFLKKWSLNTKDWKRVGFSMMGYNALLIAWIIAMWKSNEISIVGTIWLLLGHGCLILVGAGIFNEPITTTQWCGIGLAVVSLILMTL